MQIKCWNSGGPDQQCKVECMMNNPNLVTAPDERERCCVLDDQGNRCTQSSRFWVGSNSWDDYTYVCGDHVMDVKQDGDMVEKL